MERFQLGRRLCAVVNGDAADAMARIMTATDAPPESFERLGLRPMEVVQESNTVHADIVEGARPCAA